jgi:predicted AlkP superfamily pyrophosphatase or phosphodiesterase
MWKYACTLLLGLSALQGYAQKTLPARPKLVVGVVLDQMRWDYLYRYYDRYSNEGFKRLMNEGFNCENTNINYLPSFTAPGHASIYTGAVPALHGIAANDWVNIKEAQPMYCTQDDGAACVGSTNKAGNMSPVNLLATTVTDELRLATNFRSKTIGISLKDRGAILPAGRSASAAYWFEGEEGKFISSTYYMQELPTWLQDFNKRNITDSLLNIDWETLYPINTYTQSTADDNEYEAPLKGKKAAVFPHQLKEYIGTNRGIIKSTPWGNTLTRLMAEAALVGEQLGKGAYTDFLAVSFSSTDYIGHTFAPNSIEVEDCYLRMDRELAQFLKFLDNQIGKGNYTLFLTADHGGAHNVTFLQDHKIRGNNISQKKLMKAVNDTLQAVFGQDSLVYLTNYQVYFNDAKISSNNIDRGKLTTVAKQYLEQQNDISFVLNMKNASTNIVPSKILEMAVNGYHPKRSGELLMILNPGDYLGYGAKGTTHGSWNPYDSRIPLLFYGWGIKKGNSFKPYKMVDIAPTLAALLHIQEPNACIGSPITEVLK